MDGGPSPGGGEPVNDTLNAIGALIQMQQQQTATGSPSQGQLVLTRSYLKLRVDRPLPVSEGGRDEAM